MCGVSRPNLSEKKYCETVRFDFGGFFFICCTYQDKMVRRIEIGKQTDNVIHEHEWIKS